MQDPRTSLFGAPLLWVVTSLPMAGCQSGDDPDASADATTSSDETTDEESTAGDDAETGGSAGDPLVVDVAWLEEHLEDPNLQLIDTREAPTDGHIPGAIPLRPLDLATTVDGVATQAMPAAEAEPVLAAAGLENGTTVVVYGEPPEFDPARIVWSLHYYGHWDVRYLDGGWSAWMAADGSVADGPPVAVPSDYTIDAVDESLRVTGDWVLEQLGDAPYEDVSIGIADVRSPAEYAAGRVPTAINVEWTETLDAGLLRSPEELAALYGDFDPSATTISYCLVGWRGSVGWLTLRRAGFEDVRLYDGSWTEWGAGDFPVETD